jgi:hypothetical protein
MQAIAAYVSPLSLDVPPPTPQRSVLDRMSAKQIHNTIEKQEKKIQKKDQHSDSDDEMENKMRKLDDRVHRIQMMAERELADKGPDKAYKIEEKRREELHKVQEDREKLEEKGAKRSRKRCEKQAKTAETDMRQVEKMQYLVIEALR